MQAKVLALCCLPFLACLERWEFKLICENSMALGKRITLWPLKKEATIEILATDLSRDTLYTKVFWEVPIHDV